MNQKTRTLVFTAFFAALTAVLAQISIPIPFTQVPLSLATLGGYLAVGLLRNYKAAAASQLVYVLLGAVGVPVFAFFTGGLGIIVGPTGGYLIGYIISALVAGFVLSKTNGKFHWHIISMMAGSFFLYSFGTIWYMILTHTSLVPALMKCVVIFLPNDAIKITLASVLSTALRPALQKMATSASSH